jgi:MHS family proline/betaine transporter-like MFS transporter
MSAKRADHEIELKTSSTGSTEKSAEVPVDRATLRKVTLAASVGSGIEYFDLVVYGAMAPILARVFFPSSDPAVGLLSTFAVFALAFVARPLGGLFWGPLGDRIGRKRTLAAIIIVMALSSAAIGLLPGYAEIGVLAPILLILCRFGQGISAGGEMPGAATLVGEYSSDRKRGLQTSFLQWGVTTGQIAALLFCFALSAVIPAEDMQSWGWRIPFLIALPLGAIGLYIRSRIAESPDFEKVEQLGAKTEHPVKALLGSSRGWKMLGRATLFNLPVGVPAYLLLTFMPAFLVSTVHLTSAEALLAVTIAIVLAMVVQPIGGLLSDRFGRRPLLGILCLTQLATAFPAFILLNTGGFVPALAGLMLLGFIHGIATGCQSAPVLESFPTPIRFTGYALALGLSTALLSGPTPYVATWLIGVTGSSFAPAWLIVVCAIPALIGAFFIKETNNRPLPTR